MAKTFPPVFGGDLVSVDTKGVGHLHAAARAEAVLDDEARIRHLHRGRWIRYPRAAQALQQLERLLAMPERQRMPRMVLHADFNIGKKLITAKFLRQMLRDDLDERLSLD
jgi:hypothetical protein